MNRKRLIILLITFIFLQFSNCFAQDWKTRRSNHFIVYYKEAPEDFIDNVIEEAEGYYNSITSDLGFTRFDSWAWEERAKIYIYNDKQEFTNATQQPSWAAGAAQYQEKKISTYPLAAGFFDTMLPHELGHIIFREFVGTRDDLPLWLEEGVASYEEKSRRFEASKIVKQAILNKKFVPLPDLFKAALQSSQDKDFVELFYAESASLVYFLLTKFNKHNFTDFCKALKDGKNFDQALHEGYPRFDNIEDLNRQWLRFLENE